MKYFVMGEDENLKKYLKFKLGNQTLDFKDPFAIEDIYFEDDVIVDFTVQRTLFNSHFFVSTELMKVLKMYDSEIDFNSVFIASSKIGSSYFKLSMVRTEDLEEIGDKHIYLIYKDNQAYLLLSVYAAESVLRRFPIGISFKEWVNE